MKHVPLIEFAELNPRHFAAPASDDDPVSFVPMKAVEEETGRLDPTESRPWGKARKGYTPFQDGDVVFAKITPCMENGKYAVARGLIGGRGVGSTELFVIRTKESLDPDYLLHFLFSADVRRAAKANMRGAAGQLRVPLSFFQDLRVPYVDLETQRLIVIEIDRQVSRLRVGVTALERVRANLKRYRAAVLKAACEGTLVPTEASLARAEGRDYETGEQLLERILTARRENWTGKGTYKSPPLPDTTGLPPLPEGWTWATVDIVARRLQYGSSAKTHLDADGVPVLRMGNIVSGRLLFDELKYLPLSHDEFPALLLSVGDVLFNRTNSFELVGKSAVFHGHPAPCSFASYLIRVQLLPGYLPDLLSLFLNSMFGRQWVARVASQQVGQANVNGSKLQALPIPLPPLAEQHRIVAEVERRLSVVDELETLVATNLARAGRLRQSILAKAFSGELVPCAHDAEG